MHKALVMKDHSDIGSYIVFVLMRLRLDLLEAVSLRL